MEYQIYKLTFTGGARFGTGASGRDAAIAFPADTLFSALCLEAVKLECLDELYQYLSDGLLIFSDAFPYMQDTCFLPKPYHYIDFGEEQGDSAEKKLFKQMKYLSADDLESYLSGRFSARQAEALNGLGFFTEKISVSIRGLKRPKPYRIKYYNFYEGNGLYFIAGAEDRQYFGLLDTLMTSLSYSGIGGRRHSGLGRFSYTTADVPDPILRRLMPDSGRVMLLSCAFPKQGSLGTILKGAEYQLLHRGGFVQSASYKEPGMRKQDLYVFGAGSCFTHHFQGTIQNVAAMGTIPVWRYAKAMFLSIE